MAATDLPDLKLRVTYGQIIKIAAPISFAILIPQLNFITNNIFLGAYDDTGYALATAGITGVYYLIFSAIGYGLNNGLQSLISRRAGEDRPDEIGLLFNQGVLISLVIALIGIGLTWFGLPLLFQHFIHDTERMHQAVHFLNIRIWGLPFLYIYQMRNALLVGTNQSQFLIAGTLVEAGSNVLLDYLLIFGHCGFPELGFNGAAVASVTAEFLGMFVIYLVIRRQGISKRFGLFSGLQFQSGHAFEILRFSYPLIFQQALSIASWEYYFLLLEHQGTVALQISNAMRNVFGLFGAASWAFAATTNTMVSNILGQGHTDKIWKLIGKIMVFSVSVAIGMGLLLNVFPVPFLSVFGQEGAFIEAGIPTVRVVALAMVLMSVATILINAVIGTGSSRVSFLIELFSLILYIFYIYWALEIRHFPVHVAWMSEWVYWFGLMVPSLLFLLLGPWQKRQGKIPES